MTTRAQRRRELRAAGYRRADDKRGRRGSTRSPTLEPTAVTRAEVGRMLEEAQDKMREEAASKLLVPGDFVDGSRTEGGIILPKS